MKRSLLLLANLFVISFLSAQTVQINTGITGSEQFFRDVKFDPSDGGIVNVGYTNNGATGNDLLVVKLDVNHNIVWQTSLSNNGDDAFYRVIVCNNGDYLAIGQMYQAGIRRAVACRISALNGNILWTSVSANSSVGEVFFDVVETVNNNIALAGYDHYAPPQTNSFVVLLNSSGSTLWSFLSTRANSDGFQAIAQLPNGNLIVGGIYIELGGSYNASLLELNELTGAVTSQNTYAISTSVASIPYYFNTLSPQKFFIRNNVVVCQMNVYQGFGSPSTNCIFVYDQTTKNLSGNILYHTGTDFANGFAFGAISENDFLIGSSYTIPGSVYVSRITNGTVAYNRQLNSAVASIPGMDVSGTNAAIAGSVFITDLDGFNLFSSINLPVSTIPCDVSDANTFFLQAASSNATSQNALAMVAGGTMLSILPTIITPVFTVDNVCGFVIPVTLIDFYGSYNKSTSSSVLQWNTASELNSKLFSIERSVDGGAGFSAIGTVTARGTSNTVVNYQYTDNSPRTGINLYRLRQVDLDDKFQYSNIISIEVKKAGSIFSLFPVPAADVTYLNSSAMGVESVEIIIIDGSGKIVKKQRSLIGYNQSVKLGLQNLSPGVYYVKVLSSKNDPETIQLLIK
ncbi:MAG: T9SS type A sorting domain-containing protein [Ferruginibacter sp.]